MKGGDWDTAVTKCDEALKLDSSQEMARDKRQKAEAEKKNHAAYLNFIAFADKNDLDAAARRASSLDGDHDTAQRCAFGDALQPSSSASNAPVSGSSSMMDARCECSPRAAFSSKKTVTSFCADAMNVGPARTRAGIVAKRA